MFYRFAAYGFLKNLRLFDPFIILFFLDAGLSFTEIGLLFAIREISTNILEIPTGVFADSFGRRRTMVLSMGSYILSFALFYLMASFIAFAVAMVLFGLGEAARTGTHKAMILEYLRIRGMEDRKVEYYGATRSYSQLGSAVNALLAAFVVFYTGNYREIFLITILPYLVNFVNLATYPRELDGEILKGKRRARIRATLGDFAGMFRKGAAVRAMLNSSVFMASFKATKDYLQPILNAFALTLPVLLYLSGEQRSAIVIGLVYSLIYIVSSASSRTAHRVVERVGDLARAINVTLVTGALTLIFAGLFAHMDLAVPAIGLFLLLHVIHNLRRPMNVGYISEKISSRVMASGLSVESQLKTFITSGFAVLMGVLADAFGVGPALAAVGMILLLASPALFVRD